MVRGDRERVAEHHEILPVQNALLVFGKVVETQKAGSCGDRFLINRRDGTFHPCRIMMEPYGEPIAPDFFHLHAIQSFISFCEHFPRCFLCFQEIAAKIRKGCLIAVSVK